VTQEAFRPAEEGLALYSVIFYVIKALCSANKEAINPCSQRAQRQSEIYRLALFFVSIQKGRKLLSRVNQLGEIGFSPFITFNVPNERKQRRGGGRGARGGGGGGGVERRKGAAVIRCVNIGLTRWMVSDWRRKGKIGEGNSLEIAKFISLDGNIPRANPSNLTSAFPWIHPHLSTRRTLLYDNFL